MSKQNDCPVIKANISVSFFSDELQAVKYDSRSLLIKSWAYPTLITRSVEDFKLSLFLV